MERILNSMRQHVGRVDRAALLSAMFATFVTMAQPLTDDLLSFETASVKRAPDFGSAVTRIDPQLVTFRDISLQSLLVKAWHLKPYQLVGPDWLATDFYDIRAKLPEQISVKQVPDALPSMLQNLLKERFKLELHMESKRMRGYALIATRGGQKLYPSRAVELPRDNEGRILSSSLQEVARTGKIVTGLRFGAGKLQAGRATLTVLADGISSLIGLPVLDQTGIAGEYDFSLSVAPQDVVGTAKVFYDDSPSETESIFTSVKQYGLTLEMREVLIELLVVDHAQRDPIPD
jgi:uncharacterized protein (TIGR03435 family)